MDRQRFRGKFPRPDPAFRVLLYLSEEERDAIEVARRLDQMSVHEWGRLALRRAAGMAELAEVPPDAGSPSSPGRDEGVPPDAGSPGREESAPVPPDAGDGSPTYPMVRRRPPRVHAHGQALRESDSAPTHTKPRRRGRRRELPELNAALGRLPDGVRARISAAMVSRFGDDADPEDIRDALDLALIDATGE